MLFACCISLLIVGVVPFQQDDYVVVYERIEVDRFDTDYVESLKTVNFKYNRTFTVSNISEVFKVDFKNDLQVQVQAYRLASNEYRLFPMSFEYNFCSAAKANDFGLQNLYKCGNFTTCPMKKGQYHICNFSPDYSRFPPHMPVGSYRMDLRFLYFTVETKVLQFYCTVKKPFHQTY